MLLVEYFAVPGFESLTIAVMFLRKNILLSMCLCNLMFFVHSQVCEGTAIFSYIFLNVNKCMYIFLDFYNGNSIC